MSIFFDGQPEPERLARLIEAEAVRVALLFHLDIDGAPFRVCSQTVGFRDRKWGARWEPGAGMMVGLPQLGGQDGELAPFREYHLGMIGIRSAATGWQADIVDLVGRRSDWVWRDMALWLQFFDMAADEPVGFPVALDTGVMSKMSAQFGAAGSLLTLGVESAAARKGVPLGGLMTYRDQLARFPGDKGMEFTIENGKLITWTQW